MKGMLGLLLLGGCDDAPPVATGMGELLGIGDSYQDIVGDGTGVVWVGYMRPRPDAEAFADCVGEMDVLRERLALVDGRLGEMVFVDGVDIGTGAEAELYAEDGYHTSEEGSAQLGALVASAIQEAEAAR